ncbi:hypothetical protein CL620_05015 [archaeon]|jgi:hypothetical protein|nr:hypothetical protein [archaeon]|tara:strand:+ start:1268 stop:1474 length:207 start_codon:yes stop_codon:yes gene_type:complete
MTIENFPKDGKIWVSLGITKNLGNYESLRLDAGAEVRTNRVDDDSEWEHLWEKVDEQIEIKLSELDKD